MKKLKRFSILMLVISSLLLAGFLVYEKATLDVIPPVITCPDGVFEVSLEASEKDLLRDVTAADDQSGDVTSAIVVENLSFMREDNTRTITYAVVDDAGNVGRAQRQLHYSDYEKPRFHLENDYIVDMEVNLPELTANIRATSSLDGDITGNIKFSQMDDESLFTAGLKKLEFTVTDSAGVTATLPVTMERVQEGSEDLQVVLSDYLVYIRQGERFDPYRYIDRSAYDGILQIEGAVNSKHPGVYPIDYIADDGTHQGKSQLIVVVEAGEEVNAG